MGPAGFGSGRAGRARPGAGAGGGAGAGKEEEEGEVEVEEGSRGVDNVNPSEDEVDDEARPCPEDAGM